MGEAGKLLVTTSWDDGHPADLKLAELLAKYRVTGTFYVPTRNSEGPAVMNESQIRQLASAFEVAGHSIDHVVLTRLERDEASRQIRENKRWLENVTGRPVPGFAYVRGRYNTMVRDLVEEAGFEYGRTVENLHHSVAGDPFLLPTTIQLFPHDPGVYVRNFLRNPRPVRVRLLLAALAPGSLSQRIDRMIKSCAGAGGYFHLWGHSWEIDEHGLWDTLEAALSRLSSASDAIEFVTNHEAHRSRSARLTRPPSAQAARNSVS